MKQIIFVLSVVAALTHSAVGQETFRSTSSLEVVSDGRTVTMDEAKQISVKFWFQQLMMSGVYRNGFQEASMEAWQHGLGSASRIHCRYFPSATLGIPERRMLTFSEALLPLPSHGYPDFIFVKHAERVFRIAKYDPWVLHKLVIESGFSLFSSLSTVERGLF